MSALIECVPNFSEGRNEHTLARIAEAISLVPDVSLLHQDQGQAANRTVFTFAGRPAAVVEAAFQAIRVASEYIDMRQHQGEHPRIGATDVCPLIPISGINLEETVVYARQLAERVHTELDIPIYLYEAAATSQARRNLAYIRKGEYEGLEAKMKQPEGQADFGTNFNAKAGATVIGARNFLVAYNINLKTKDTHIAKRIAAEIRESGRKIRIDGQWQRQAGRFKAVKAIGWYIEEYKCTQVSMNLIDFQTTGMHTVFEACKSIAANYGVELNGSELIGLVPLQALLDAGRYYAPTAIQESDLIDATIQGLGLDALAPFLPQERVVEYCL